MRGTHVTTRSCPGRAVCNMRLVLVALFAIGTCLSGVDAQSGSNCAQSSCSPKAGDLVIGRQESLTATSTCGLKKLEIYCVVTGADIRYRDKCFPCLSTHPWDAVVGRTSHRIENIVSRVPFVPSRWWQSANGIHNVTIQIDFETEFQFVYTQLRFKTYRPAAMFIERSYDFGRTWEKYAYYSENCKRDFPGIPVGKRQKLQQATCEHEYSQLVPSEFGLVTYTSSPSDLHEDNDSLKRQAWSKMTNLRAVFTRLNTLGDWQVDDSVDVKRKYYYAVNEWVIRGRCSCYGHASECQPEENQPRVPNMVYGICKCQHHTTGTNCEKCEDFYSDVPWSPATVDSANECQKCNCNEHSKTCVFHELVYHFSGNKSGGLCTECQHNTAGTHCDECIKGTYRVPGVPITSPDTCRECDCHEYGRAAEGTWCEQVTTKFTLAGRCICKKNVAGNYCDRCASGFWNFTQSNPLGCQPCACNMLGTLGNVGCDQYDGRCTCKRFVVGQTCDKCAEGYFNLTSQADGCTPCGCSPVGSVNPMCDGGSGQCVCKRGFTGRTCTTIKDGFFIEIPPLTIRVDQRLRFTINPVDDTGMYFIILKLRGTDFSDDDKWYLEIGIEQPGSTKCQREYRQIVVNSTTDKIVIPSVCLETKIPGLIDILVTDRGNNPNAQIIVDDVFVIPQTDPDTNTTRRLINICEKYRGYPRNEILEECLKYLDQKTGTIEPQNPNTRECVCNVTGAVTQICSKYGGQCVCKPGVDGRTCDRCAANFYGFDANGCKACNCKQGGSKSLQCDLETGVCPCLQGIEGQQCDRCLSGFWNFPYCSPCQCNGLATICEDVTGYCLNCTDFTTGRFCDKCRTGYYGDPRRSVRCKPCRCPGVGEPPIDHSESCGLNISTNAMACYCKKGYIGTDCSKCAPNFYGNPLVQDGGCKPCICSLNINREVPNSCDSRTGECLKCLHNTTGFNCEECLEGFFGDATKRDCKLCVCNKLGTVPKLLYSCDRRTGACPCLNNVEGINCDKCKANHFNLSSGLGCDPCQCDPDGSVLSDTCNLLNGQCLCKDGRGGRRCNECKDLYWGDPSKADGCKKCTCNPLGSSSLQCDRQTGSCHCKLGVVGRYCDRCNRGTSGKLPNCVPCGECWYTWDDFLSKMLNETYDLVVLADSLDNTGSLPKDLEIIFLNLTRMINEIIRIASEGNATSADLAKLQTKLDIARRRIIAYNLTDENLAKSQEELNGELKKVAGMKDLYLQLQANYDKVLAKFKLYEDRARNISRQDISGAYDQILRAKNRTDRAVARINKFDNQANVLTTNYKKYEAVFMKLSLTPIDKTAVETKINVVKEELKGLNSEVCGDDGKQGDPTMCNSTCGGGGCGSCGGPDVCKNGAKNKYTILTKGITDARHLLVKTSFLSVQKPEEEMLNARTLSKVSAKDALQALEMAQQLSNIGSDVFNESSLLIVEVRQFLNDTKDLTPEAFKALTKQVNEAALKYNQTEIDELIKALNYQLSLLKDIDSILAETKRDREVAKALENRANNASRRAEDLLKNVTQIEEALKKASEAQKAAEEQLHKAMNIYIEIFKRLALINQNITNRETFQKGTDPIILALEKKLDVLEKNMSATLLAISNTKKKSEDITRNIAFIKTSIVPPIDKALDTANDYLGTLNKTHIEMKNKLLKEAQDLTANLTAKLNKLTEAQKNVQQMEQSFDEVNAKIESLLVDIVKYGNIISKLSFQNINCNP